MEAQLTKGLPDEKRKKKFDDGMQIILNERKSFN